MPALTPHYAPVLHVRQARGQVGTLQAGTVTRLSAASSKLCYFMMLFFSSEWFLFKFQSLAFPLPFSFFFLFCMVMSLEQNRPWNQNGPGKGNRFSWFLHFTSQSPTAERPSVLACRFTARWEAYLLVSKSLATTPTPPHPPSWWMYLHIFLLCDVTQSRGIKICKKIKNGNKQSSIVWLQGTAAECHAQK